MDDMSDQVPLLIIIQGAPGSGKTTLAHRLKEDLTCGLVASDDVKEYFFDTIGAGNLEWSKALGRALKPLCYDLVKIALQHDRSVIFEAAFWPELAKVDMQKLLELPINAVEIYCHVDPEVREQRYKQRALSGERHSGHVSMADDIIEAERYQPIGVCERIDYNTTTPSEDDYKNLVATLQRKMG